MSDELRDGQQWQRLVQTLADNRHDAVSELFEQAGARPPLIVWSPATAQLIQAELVEFARHIATLPTIQGLPSAAAFEIDALPALAPWLMLLEVREAGLDFRYLHYGSGIYAHYGRDMTHHSVFDFGGHISAFFAALYLALTQRQLPVLSEHEPPRRIFVRCWRRYLVPLAGPDGRITRIAGCNLPESPLRAGLDILPDPAFVFDAKQILHFANRAALRLFDWPGCPQELELNALFGDILADGLRSMPQSQLVMRCKLKMSVLPRRHFEIVAGHVVHAGQPLWLLTLRDITRQLRDERKIKRLAETDALTGLANRRRFEQVLEGLIASGEAPFALFLVDLDGFKRINDRFGHLTGDALLNAVGRRLKRRCRSSECVARIGGDEFAIILPGIGTSKQAEKRAADMQRAFADPFHVADHMLTAAASIGHACFPAQASDRDALMLAADHALYEKKPTRA